MARQDIPEVVSSYGTLYVPMRDINDKRRSLLESIKDSLIVQEEYEKVIEIRKVKSVVLKDIKTGMDDLNKSYQKLKKKFPNIKNVLTNTEKEIQELELHIQSLKSHMKNDQNEIKTYENMEKKLKGEEVIPEPIVPDKKAPEKEAMIKSTDKKKPGKKVNKMDRIKNNLKVIEGKLDKL